MTEAVRSEPKPLVIIVEDEEELARLMAEHLEEAGMLPQVYTRAAPALRFLKRNFANLILLDLNLPDQTGFSLVEDMKKEDIETPVIFVTGNSSEIDKIRGLEMGGDDYITKPFSYPELIARIRAVLRRTESAADTKVTKNARLTDEPFEFCGVRIDPGRLEAEFSDGERVSIGRKQFGILHYLHANQGTVVTRKAMIHGVWGIHADVRSRSLDQYMVKIRELLANRNIPMDTFRTVHGIGYIYDPEGVSEAGK